ncbi:MAG: hypothetical protein KKE11_02585 [Gammaproteobacteria bacterium]|nr:hypothetical protein [Gammaproteobacteria bacterium]
MKKGSNYLATFLAHLISLVLLVFLHISFFFVNVAYAEKSASEKFQEAMQYTGSLRDSVRVKDGVIRAGTLEFKPQDVFKDQKGGYTKNPSQINHYQGVTQNNADAMKRAARVESAKDEDYKDKDGKTVRSPGKAITEGFNTRPVYKITQDEEYVKKGRLVTDNALNVVSGESNKHIDCENKKMIACKIIHVEKTCNEEINTVQRICEKVPKVKIVIQPYQEAQQYSGSIPVAKTKLYYNLNVAAPDSGIRTGAFTLPVSGTITSFSASFGSRHINFGSWRCCGSGGRDMPDSKGAIRGYLNGNYLSTSCVGWDGCASWVYNMSYNNSNLNIPVVAGQPITFHIEGLARSHWSSSHYDLVIMADLTRKVANIEPGVEENCRDT